MDGRAGLVKKSSSPADPYLGTYARKESNIGVEQVRSATRPDDPGDAAAWDAIGYVHLRGDLTAVGPAVKHFGDFIKKLSDNIKEAKEKLKKAEEANESAQLEGLKGDLASKQELLFRAVDAAVKKGSIRVLQNLGGNAPLVANLVSALRDCVNTSDFKGKMPKALLRLMSLFVTVSEETLNHKLKFDKIQKRFLAKGDAEVKELVNKITDNTVEARERQHSETAMPAGSQPPAAAGPSKPQQAAPSDATKASKTASRVPSDPPAAKRPRDDDSDARVVKKIASNSANGTPQALSAKPPAPAKAVAVPTGSQPPSAQAKLWSGSALLPGKLRPVGKPVAAKSEPTKLEPPKAPGASKADTAKPAPAVTKREAAKPDAPKVKKPVAKREPPPPGKSRLGALLEGIENTPKPAPQAAQTPESSSELSETPEERAERLRKESRRKLRVKWRDDKLVEVFIIEKGIDEDGGRELSLVRDAHDHDGRSEAMALRKGALHLEDEEEDELPYRPWVEPSLIDFSLLPAQKRKETYTVRGGTKVVSTNEQKAMAERENKVLMTVYTDPSDIPPTPKSPPPSEAGPLPSGHIYLPNGDPKFSEVFLRWKESQTLPRLDCVQNAWQRANLHRQQRNTDPPHANVSGVALDFRSAASSAAGQATRLDRGSDIVRLLKSDRAKAYTAPPPPEDGAAV